MGVAKTRPDALSVAGETLYPKEREKLLLILEVGAKYGSQHSMSHAFWDSFRKTVSTSCREEFYSLLDSNVMRTENTTCGSDAETFWDTAYVVYLSPERRGEAKNYGCNDAFVVTVDGQKWLQLATFNNEQEAMELARKIFGWYVKKNIPVNYP